MKNEGFQFALVSPPLRLVRAHKFSTTVVQGCHVLRIEKAQRALKADLNCSFSFFFLFR